MERAKKTSPASTSSSSLHPVLKLQRTIGNQSLGRLLKVKDGSEPPAMSHPQDASEREADRISENISAENRLLADSRLEQVKGNSNQLPTDLSSSLGSSLGVDFEGVRVHNDSQAAEAAHSVNARAFTVGNDIVFGAGEFSPQTTRGRKLIAHELAHVAQQSEGAGGTLRSGSQPSGAPIARQAASGATMQRTPDESAASESEPRATSFRRITMHFNGAELIVSGDGREVLRFSGRSGRPVRLSETDARECGANVATDSYLSDRRFVGIEDHGPIPEGAYTFSPGSLERFSPDEESSLLWGGIRGRHSVNIRGRGIHPGDWGSGRVALQRRGRVLEGPCGNANKRKDFFLHGGILAGSSGCIDIGGNFSQLADFLSGYRRPVVLTVSYTEPPPSVGVFTGLAGAVAYHHFGFGHGPSLHLGAEFAPHETRGVASVGYDAFLQWAGGALSGGVRLDVPFNDREAFVRVALDGGVNFRILRGLYGQLMAGYSWDVSGASRESGLEVGAGLEYDFGRVQLEALYNVLRPAASDQRVHQAMLGLGFHF